MARTNDLTDFLTDVANAIKNKKGDTTDIPASEFDTEIMNLPSQGIYQSKQMTINTNGNYEIMPDNGYDAIESLRLSVNVPSSGDIKLFRTEQAMQADPNPSEGDLAVVYREELTAVTADSEFSGCTFPNTVVLPTAYSSDFWGRFGAADESSGYFDGNVQLSASSFRFDGYGDSSEIRVEYESEDGITYTRTDGGEELQDFGVAIKYEQMGEWDDTLGYFMKIGGNYFEGLYEYKNNVIEKDLIVLPAITDIVSIQDKCNITQSYTYVYNISDIEAVLNKIYEDNYASTSIRIDGILIMYDNSLCYLAATEGNFALEINTSLELQNTILSNAFASAPSTSVMLYTLNLTNHTYSTQDISSLVSIVDAGGSTTRYARRINLMPQSIPVTKCVGTYDDISMTSLVAIRQGDNYLSVPVNSGNNANAYQYIHNTYVIAPSQLDATSDYVYENTFYGKNGIEEGTLSNMTHLTKSQLTYRIEIYNNILNNIQTDETDLSECFYLKSNLTTIPLFDTSNVTNMRYMFSGCTSLTTIPQLNTSNATNMNSMFWGCTSLAKIPLLNTSNVTDMYQIFRGCSTLTTIPLLDTSNATDISYMFTGCTNLATIPQLDTTNVTNMSFMFNGCSNLTTIPLLNTSNVTNGNMYSMFNNCTSLSNESLNNILAMCINATKITSNKTLKYLNLTSSQATTCQSLSNYSAFIAAGWTTGY